jgi:tetratricopeptide (TPR) repeat protein
MSSEAPAISTAEMLQAALRHHEAGRFDEAEQGYRQVIDREPGNADALHLLGVLVFQRRRPAEAVDLIRKAIAIAPTVPDFYNDLGCALRDVQDLPGSIAAWQQAVSLSPNHVQAKRNIADALYNGGQTDAAILLYTQVIQLDPNLAEAHRGLSDSFQRKGQMAEAIESMKEAVRLRPDRVGWKFRLSALMGDQSVKTMPSEVVRRLFDAYAPKFDTDSASGRGFQGHIPRGFGCPGPGLRDGTVRSGFSILCAAAGGSRPLAENAQSRRDAKDLRRAD